MNTKPELKQTTNYGRFACHPRNRPFKEDKKLVASMRKYGFLPSNPIHVTANGTGAFRILQGHHRFEIAKRLGLPVWYIEHETDANIFDLEASTHSSWSIRDFVHAYANAGRDSYQFLLDWSRCNRIPLGIAASLLAGQGAGSANQTRKIKTGLWKQGDMKHASEVAYVTNALHVMGISFATTTNFLRALSMVLRVPEMEVEVLLQRIQLNPRKMDRCSTTDAYLQQLEEVYNYRAHKKKMPLAFEAKRITRARTAVRTEGR